MEENIVLEKDCLVGQRIDSIQLLRAVSCIVISFHHINFIFNLGLGTDFVEIFFVISGFVIVLSTEKSTKKYISKRLVRVVPLYWIMTLVTFGGALLFPKILGHVNELQLLKSMFFIPFMRDGLRSTSVVRPLVGLGWTLELEIIFYVIFGLAILINHKYRSIISAVFLGILGLLGLTCNFKNVMINFWCSTYLFDFIYGIVLYYIIRALWKYDLHISTKTIFKLLAAGLVVYLIFVTKIPCIHNLPRYLIRGIPATLVVFFTSLAYKDVKIPKVFMIFGRISFSYYMLHYYIILVIHTFICNLDYCSTKNIIVALFSICICFGSSWICWFVVENKFTGWIKKKLRI